MVPKKYRFQVQQAPRSPAQLIKSRYFFIKAWPGAAKHSRLAVVVGARVDKRASRRNALKRSLYDAARPWLLAARPPVDIVAALQSAAVGLKPEQLAQEFDKLLHRI